MSVGDSLGDLGTWEDGTEATSEASGASVGGGLFAAVSSAFGAIGAAAAPTAIALAGKAAGATALLEPASPPVPPKPAQPIAPAQALGNADASATSRTALWVGGGIAAAIVLAVIAKKVL